MKKESSTHKYIALSSVFFPSSFFSTMEKPKRVRVAQFCYEFANSDSCRYGENCGFNHNLETFLGQSWPFLQRQQQLKLSPPRQESCCPPLPFTSSFETVSHESSSSVLHVHGNGIVAICLGPTHPVFAQAQNKISSIVCKEVLIGQGVETEQVLVEITLASGEMLPFVSPIPGKVVQFNPKLALKPEFMLDQPETKGFICLVKVADPLPLLFARFFSERKQQEQPATSE